MIAPDPMQTDEGRPSDMVFRFLNEEDKLYLGIDSSLTIAFTTSLNSSDVGLNEDRHGHLHRLLLLDCVQEDVVPMEGRVTPIVVCKMEAVPFNVICVETREVTPCRDDVGEISSIDDIREVIPFAVETRDGTPNDDEREVTVRNLYVSTKVNVWSSEDDTSDVKGNWISVEE